MSGKNARRHTGHVEIESAHGAVSAYVRHPNGGGLVEVTARVHDGATVHESAYVEAGAVVGDGTRIGASSWVDADVTIGARVLIGRNVHLGSGSRIADGAVVLGPQRRSPRSDFGTAA